MSEPEGIDDGVVRRTTVRISDETYRRLREWCDQEGISLNSLLCALGEIWVRGHDALPGETVEQLRAATLELAHVIDAERRQRAGDAFDQADEGKS
jgi:hypothetical protein